MRKNVSLSVRSGREYVVKGTTSHKALSSPGLRIGSKMVRILGWLFLVWLLAACGGVVEKGMKPATDWSRGLPLGESARGSVGVAAETDGSRLHFVWPFLADTGVRVRYVQIEPDGRLLAETRLELPYLRNRAPRLMLGGEGRLHLVLASRPSRESGWQLWYLPLDRADGSSLEEPRLLSAPEGRVGSFDMASDGFGGLLVAWEQESPDEIFGLHLGPDGQVLAGPQVVVAPGTSPALRVDQAGVAHLTWVSEEIQYAALASFPSPVEASTTVADVTIGTGDSLYGPVLGLSDGWVYVLWSRLSRSGLEAGTAQTFYVTFPQGSPEAVANPERLYVLPIEEQPYETFEGSISLTQLVRIGAAGATSDFIYEPVTVQGQPEELVVGFSVEQALRQDVHVQIGVAVFSEGQLQGYGLAGKTGGLSGEPVLSTDISGDLFLVWREGALGDGIFYTTTEDEARAVIDRLSFDDLLSTTLSGGVEGLATVLLFPLAIPWLVPGFLLLVVWKIFRDQESLLDRSSWVVLIVAVLLYQGTKLLFFPSFVTYLPFSAWVDIPPAWSGTLRIGVPLFNLGVSIAVAELGRRRSPATFLYYSLLVLTDMVLTLGIYGVSYLGVF